MLRRAVASDIDRIVAFEAEVMDERLYGTPLDHDAVRSEIEKNEYYVHLRDGRLVATGALRWRGDGSVYLSNVAVHTEVRQKGFARAMMRHLFTLCSDAPSMDLAVHPDNQPALALYASLGFVPLRRHEDFLGDGEPRLIMVRTGVPKA